MSGGTVAPLPTPEDHAVLQFALRWAAFGGGHADDIFIAFGWNEKRYFTRLQALLHADAPAALDESTRTDLLALCAHRIGRFRPVPQWGRSPVTTLDVDPARGFRDRTPHSAHSACDTDETPLTVADLLSVLEALTGSSHRLPASAPDQADRQAPSESRLPSAG